MSAVILFNLYKSVNISKTVLCCSVNSILFNKNLILNGWNMFPYRFCNGFNASVLNSIKIQVPFLIYQPNRKKLLADADNKKIN